MNKKYYLAFLVIGIVCWLVYFNSLFAPLMVNEDLFRFDTQSIQNTWQYKIGGDRFALLFFHLGNVGLHTVNSFLVFLFLTLFFDPIESLLGALLFAVNPIQTETVNWLCARRYLFFAFYILLPYLLYYHATKEKLKVWYYILALELSNYYLFVYPFYNPAFYAGLFLLLILSDWYFKSIKKNWLLWLPFLAMFLVKVFVMYGDIIIRVSFIAGKPLNMDAVVFLDELNFNSYLFERSFYTLFANLGLIFWPVKLAFYHEPVIIIVDKIYSIMGIVISLIIIFGTIFGCGIILPILIDERIKKIFFSDCRKLAFICLFFFIFLWPVFSPITICPIIAERYLYLPAILLSFLFAFFWQKLGIFASYFKKTFFAIFLMIFLFFGIRTIIRNADYCDMVRFWSKEVAVVPKSFRSYNNLGTAYLRVGNEGRAVKAWVNSLNLNPEHDSPLKNLIAFYGRKGRQIERIELGDTEATIKFRGEK